MKWNLSLGDGTKRGINQMCIYLGGPSIPSNKSKAFMMISNIAFPSAHAKMLLFPLN
jgi:hypothetical protein